MAAEGGRFPGRAPIDSYGNGGFRFAGMSHRGSILCLPSAIMAWDAVRVADIGSDCIAPLIAESYDANLLLLGTGDTIEAPPAWLRPALQQAGIALEIMDTGAAIRTYNILLGEKRPVAAALIAAKGSGR